MIKESNDARHYIIPECWIIVPPETTVPAEENHWMNIQIQLAQGAWGR
jgi:hypothetical protein